MKICFNIMRTVISVLSCISAIYFLFMMCVGILNIGSAAGFLLSLWIFCVSTKPLYRFLSVHLKKHFITRILYRLVNVCFALFLIYGAVITGLMVYCASKAPAENATAVVLGAQVKSYGPSVILQGRITAAEKYLNENPETSAVLTGGRGSDEPMSEAESMYESLVNARISLSRLYKEEEAVNTTENLKFSVEIIDAENLESDIAVVTDGFHQLRAQIAASQLGIEGNVGAVNADTSLKYLPVFAVREWFAIPNQLLFR